MMLCSTRTLLNLAEDPDYPAPRFIPQISGKLRQFESFWENLNNPMSDAGNRHRVASAIRRRDGTRAATATTVGGVKWRRWQKGSATSICSTTTHKTNSDTRTNQFKRKRKQDEYP
jgi:hypothetical protein